MVLSFLAFETSKDLMDRRFLLEKEKKERRERERERGEERRERERESGCNEIKPSEL